MARQPKEGCLATCMDVGERVEKLGVECSGVGSEMMRCIASGGEDARFERSVGEAQDMQIGPKELV